MIKKTKDRSYPKEPYKVKKYYVTGHAIQQMNGRKISKGNLYYNLTRKPLVVTKVKYDFLGRPSYNRTTKNKVCSSINPLNNSVITVHKIHTKEYNKLINLKKSKRRKRWNYRKEAHLS